MRALRQLPLLMTIVILSLLGTNAGLADSNSLGSTLLARPEQKQVIEFNPGAALQKRIFDAAFVPNSGEFSVSYNGLGYTAQRAESLMSRPVRVYYGRVGGWDNVRYVERGGPDDTAGSGSYGSALHHYAIVYPSDWTRLVNLPE